MTNTLAIWLHDTKVAFVDEERQRLSLTYTPLAIEKFPSGTPLLSLALPVRTEKFGNGVVRPFLDGLLPEGDSRRVLAEDFRLRADDTFGLIKALGRDCAGALVIQPLELEPPRNATTTTADPLTDDALVALVSKLRTTPLGIDQHVRISLAGVQEKLLLTLMPDGKWGRPVDGTPSTHILKPQIRGYPKSVENEAFCMRLARHLGLPVANVETLNIAGGQFIVIERFDRRLDSNGNVERIHQEDLCQAMKMAPTKKYEEDGGPSLRKFAAILQATDPDSLDRLLCALILHVLVGNGDAHGKNYSLIHLTSGALKMAPLYDIMSTLYYGDDRLAMYVDNVRRIEKVTVERIVNEGTSWGMSRKHVKEIVTQLLDSIKPAMERAADETAGIPNEILEIVSAQLSRLQSA